MTVNIYPIALRLRLDVYFWFTLYTFLILVRFYSFIFLFSSLFIGRGLFNLNMSPVSIVIISICITHLQEEILFRWHSTNVPLISLINLKDIAKKIFCRKLYLSQIIILVYIDASYIDIIIHLSIKVASSTDKHIISYLLCMCLFQHPRSQDKKRIRRILQVGMLAQWI